MSAPRFTTNFSKQKGYELLFGLARGGMGMVSLVVQRRGDFERIYAMKTLHPYLLEDEAFRRMFVEEARLAGLIQHPNVVGVVDVGQGPEGPFLILEFVDGLALSTIMSERAEGELLPVEVCLRFAIDAARGLAAAHRVTDFSGQSLRLVHRDVSPQNLLVGYDGVLRVTDFGVAKAYGADGLTATGVIKGKMGYMSPEQLRMRRLDFRCDLYSLGVVLFETLTGERLYPGGAESGAALKILEDPVPDIEEFRTDVPPAVSELLFDLLAKDPEHRPESTEIVVQRLSLILEHYSGHEEVISHFMKAHFSGEQAEMQTRIQNALTGTQTSSSVLAMAQTLPAYEPTSVARVQPAQAASKRRYPRWLLGLLAIASAAAVVGAVLLRPAVETTSLSLGVTAEELSPVDNEPVEGQEAPRMNQAPAEEAPRMNQAPAQEAPSDMASPNAEELVEEDASVPPTKMRGMRRRPMGGMSRDEMRESAPETPSMVPAGWVDPEW